MKKFNKFLALGVAFSFVLVALGLANPDVVFAATSPALTGSASYSVLAGSIVTNIGPTTVAGDVGVSPSIGVPPHVTGFPPGTVNLPGVIHDADANAATAQADNTLAFGTLDQACDPGHSYAGVKDLTTLSPLAPGVYCADAFILTGNLTLTGANGVWIFKSASTLITSPDSSVTGGDPCNVWWRVASSATLDTNTTFLGNILALTDATLNGGASLDGRVMTQTGQVSLSNNVIAGPICSVPDATINVVKTVVNDNGQTKDVADFQLSVGGTLVTSGETNVFAAPATYAVTETADANYARSFSGDCDLDGNIALAPGDAKFCIVTNDDIRQSGSADYYVPPVPPLIDVVKIPNPLALPAGPGDVTYTYTLRNIGTVPVSDVTMVGDSCSPIALISGDANADAKLDLNETWKYTCTTKLTKTHTNTIVATGWANNISATDIASATVVVGVPAVVPPLIHVTKKPNVFALSAPGGAVTYTYTVTNPGTAPLSNVSISDDKCTGLPGRVAGHPGDLNQNNLLESNETWTFTCETKLTQTTSNTGTATGSANGLTARDFALATVTVATAVPKLPNTGFAPEGMLQNLVIFGVLVLVVTGLVLLVRRLRTKR